MPPELPDPATAQHDDPYSIQLVQHCIRLRDAGVWTGTAAKHLPRLGDRAAIAILKLLSPDELADPQKAKNVLDVLRGAFAHSEFIAAKDDRKPEVTLFLLNYMQEKLRDTSLYDEISLFKTSITPLK
jgi:hypothetical protein